LGEFPLLYATGGGHVDVVKILIEYGAKVNWKNHYGRTALVTAREEGYKEIEKMLINAGAKI
jgi:ankyrin repeat protein